MICYCVTSKFDDKGNGWAGITEKRECDEIPQSTFRSTKKADYYTDWFDNYDEAEAFVKSTRQ